MIKRCLLFLLPVLLIGCGSGEKKDTGPSESNLAPLTEDADHLISSETAEIEAEEDSVGLMAFYPNGSGALSALAGMNTFTFYFEKPDVEVNEGRIGLYDADALDDPLVSYVDVTDKERVEIMPIDENGISISNFSDGSMAVVRFDRQFEAGKRYYVLLDGGCFKRGDILSEGIANASDIEFTVKRYGLRTALSSSYYEGDDVSIGVLLGGDATAAGMLEYNSRFFTFTPATLHESGTLGVHFNHASPEGMPASCTLAFYNGGGQRIDSCVLNFDIKADGGPDSVPMDTVPGDGDPVPGDAIPGDGSPMDMPPVEVGQDPGKINRTDVCF